MAQPGHRNPPAAPAGAAAAGDRGSPRASQRLHCFGAFHLQMLTSGNKHRPCVGQGRPTGRNVRCCQWVCGGSTNRTRGEQERDDTRTKPCTASTCAAQRGAGSPPSTSVNPEGWGSYSGCTGETHRGERRGRPTPSPDRTADTRGATLSANRGRQGAPRAAAPPQLPAVN